MPNVHVRFETHGSTITIEIIDDLGPLNTWRAPRGSFNVDSGTFLNQARQGRAKGCGLIDCWTLREFDIDLVQQGHRGTGENNSAGTFPGGHFIWIVDRIN